MPVQTSAAVQRDPSALLTAVAGGDHQAFAQFYDLFAARVQGLVMRVLRDPHQAEEVAQEVFLEVWTKAVRFDPTLGSAESWLFTMAHRRSVDRVRSTQAASDRDNRDAANSVDRPFDSVAETVERNGDRQALHASLQGLTELQRQSITLAYFSGYTYREVAEIMSVPLPTVKTRMRDGLSRLRTSLTAA